MKRIAWVLAVVLASAWPGQGVLAEGLSAQREQEIIRNVLSIFEPESPLLQAGEELEFRKCGTPIMAEAFSLWSQLSEETRALLRPYLAERPQLEFFYDTPDGNFRIHYDTSGANGVDMSHGINAEGIPLYVDTCAQILHNVWQKEITEMGYPQPPADDFYEEGGTAAYDVYLKNLGNIYLGLTQPDEIIPGGGNGVPIGTSYLLLDNDYQGYQGYDPEQWQEMMSVTAAHEFFHAVQFGIDLSEYYESPDDTDSDIWWHEMTATWMEDIVYNEVNDYYAYLSAFFEHPDWALTSQQGLYMYGACLWPRFLSERFGNDIIHDIWMQCGRKAYLNSIEAFSEQLEARGSSFHEELGRFRLWSYYSGDRHDVIPFSFSEGMNYPTIDESQFLNQHDEYPFTDTISALIAPKYLGVAYLKFLRPTADSTIDFKLKITHDNLNLWALTAARMTHSSDPELVSTRSITGPLIVPSWQNYENLMVMVIPYSEQYTENKNIGGQVFIYEVSDTLHGITVDEIVLGPNPYNVDQGLLKVMVPRRAKEETDVCFFTVAGELVRGGRGEATLYLKEGESNNHDASTHIFTWDGRNGDKQQVASGVYLCLVRLGSQKSIQKVAVFRE